MLFKPDLLPWRPLGNLGGGQRPRASAKSAPHDCGDCLRLFRLRPHADPVHVQPLHTARRALVLAVVLTARMGFQL